MSTLIAAARPAMEAANATPQSPVLAEDLREVWTTVGHSYESLTEGIAPGNGARTVAAAHDHVTTGAPLAQPLTRWQAVATSGSSFYPLDGPAFAAMPLIYVMACLAEAPAAGVYRVLIRGRSGRLQNSGPESLGDFCRIRLNLGAPVVVSWQSEPEENPEGSLDDRFWCEFELTIPQGSNVISVEVDHNPALIFFGTPTLQTHFTFDACEVWPAGRDLLGGVR